MKTEIIQVDVVITSQW